MVDQKARLVSVSALIVGTLIAAPSLAAFFPVQDLGVFPGDARSEAWAINDRGVAVGLSGTGDSTRAVMWTEGRMVNLGSFPGAEFTIAVDINNHGLIVGRTGIVNRHALLWDRGSMIDLGRLPGANFAVASAINHHGQILGMSGNSLIPDNYAVVWDRGGIRRLFPVGNGDRVTGINKRGQVVATLFGVEEGPFAYLWADGALTRLPLLPGAQYSFAEDINDAGWIVGASGTALGELHAVLWRDGNVIDLGLAPDGIDVATASAVNDRGQIVGYGSSPTTVVAFLWERGHMIALDQPAGSTGTLPLGLNNRRQAVGAGNAAAYLSTSHALLWGMLRHP